MSNTFKYSTGIETLSLKKDNYYIGVGDVGKGPTSSTGYWQGIVPPSNGYTIYVNKEVDGPSIRVANNDSELIVITNQISNSNYTTVEECLNYFITQSDKMVCNINYESIVTDGLIVNIDAGFTPSYPRNSNILYDLSGNGNNGTLNNGPTFTNTNYGILNFDATDDDCVVSFNNRSSTYNTVEMFYRWRSGTSGMPIGFQSYDIWTPGGAIGFNTAAGDLWGINSTTVNNLNLIGTTEENWHHYVFVFSNQVQNNKMYIDGVRQTLSQINATTNLTQNRTFPSTFKLNGWNNSTGYKLSANYSFVRVYNRELTQSEVLNNYNATKYRFGK